MLRGSLSHDRRSVVELRYHEKSTWRAAATALQRAADQVKQGHVAAGGEAKWRERYPGWQCDARLTTAAGG